MSRFCDRCGKEVGIVSSTTTTADGRIVSLCAACATLPAAGPGAGSFGQAPSWAQSAAGGAPYVPSPSGKGNLLAILVGVVVVLALLVVGGATMALLVLRRPASKPQVQSANPGTPTAESTGSQESAAPGEGSARPGQVREANWDGTKPFVCKGQEQVVLRNCSGSVEDTAVRAEERCKLTLVACKLAGRTALEVRNDAEVIVQGGELTGSTGFGSIAVRVSDHARASIQGATILGTEQAIRIANQASLKLTDVTLRVPTEAAESRWPFSLAIELADDAELAMEGGSVDWGGKGVQLKDSATLVARKTSIRSTRRDSDRMEPVGLSLTGGAAGIIVEGKIKGPRIAVSIDDVSSLTLQKTVTEGEVKSEGNARLKVSKDAPDAEASLEQLQTTLRNVRAELKPEHEKITRYSKGACGGIFACYKDNFPGGAVAGTVLMRVNATGKVQSTTLQGNIPPKVAECIRTVGKERTIENFDGPVGDLVCTYSGTITKGMQMLSIKSDYRKTK
ncbi:MAG: hypothetical protein HY898_23385 [Deltaproteobacteria bacterium]|nr:hypothetical protein [Deltaproteobacteria bacterium]